MKFLIFLFLISLKLEAALTIKEVQGATHLWSGFKETHLSFCNLESNTQDLKITFSAPKNSEIKLVTSNNKIVWKQENIEEQITTTTAWSEICKAMGNKNCKQPQTHHFKLEVSDLNKNKLTETQGLFVRVLDRCQVSQHTATGSTEE